MKNNRYFNYDMGINQTPFHNNLDQNNLNNNFIYSPIKPTNSNQHKVDLSISYRNYDIDQTYRKNLSSNYCKDLQNQIREREIKKIEEKRKRQQEELLEEQRLKNERIFLASKIRDEERHRREEVEKYKLDNERIMNSYMVMSRPKQQKKEEINVPKETEEEKMKRLLEKRRKDMQFFNDNIKNTLEKIKSDMLNQQNIILKEVNKLRDQNLHSNFYKVDIAKSLSDIREELKRKKFQEEIQKDYLYGSIVESNYKTNKLNYQFEKLAGLERYPDLYINKSHNILDFRDNQNIYSTKNKFYIYPQVIWEKINKEYEKDKFELHNIFS